ncbi:MAG: hypothetical protein ACXVCY_13970 [Pseudobdellovibrionaceae bacterium]
MKKLTSPQKKWAMTAALLAVLAVNVSFSPHKNVLSTANFSSHTPKYSSWDDLEISDDTVYTVNEDGDFVEKKQGFWDKVSQKFKEARHSLADMIAPTDKEDKVDKEENNEEEQESVVRIRKSSNRKKKPKIVKVREDEESTEEETQAVYCEDCDEEKNDGIVIKGADKKTLLTIAKALKERAKKEREDEDPESKEEKEKENPFDKIAEKCEGKSDEKSVLSCLKDDFIKALRSKQAKDIEPEDALSFYQDKIQSRLLERVEESKRIASRALDSRLNPNSFMDYMNSSDSFDNPESMITEVSDIVSELVAKVPRRFESVRRTVLSAETNILKYAAAEFKNAQTSALKPENALNFPYLRVKADSLANQYNFLHDEFYSRNKGSLAQAYSNSYITASLQDQYNEYLTRFNTEITNSLLGKGTLLNGIGLNPSINLAARLATGGRGVVVSTLPTQVTPISSRTGATLATPLAPAQTALVEVPIQTTPNGTIVIPADSTGTSFATAPNALRLRAELQSRQ